MATPTLQIPTPNTLRRPLARIFLLIILSTLFYFIGSYTNTFTGSTTSSSSLLQDRPLHCFQVNFTTPAPAHAHAHANAHSSPPLQFEPQHAITLHPEPLEHRQLLNFCGKNFTDYCPCQDPAREKQFVNDRRFRKERHCPGADERPRCLVARPAGYRRPFPWPKSRDYAWFKNVPFPRLTEYKKSQNWVRLKGDRLFFPGGGTSFPKGVKGYVDEMERVVPLKSGNIRTVLDIGCGVASFGASLMDYNILTMSVAPRDIHEAQVQFALERGLPAMLGVLSTYRLPFPSRAFDMAHCSRCLVPWTSYDGLYLLEMDRVLRPGGYWVLSGPPINWRVNYKGWERPAKDLENEQISLEDLARRMCWKKISDRGAIAVWRKPANHMHCIQKLKAWKSLQLCTTPDPDAAGLAKYPLWVMNVVPFDAKNKTLGIVYERGLIGTYMNWCEAFSTYPRTYDLLHANGVFSMYLDKCDLLDILLEMYRILRPEGAAVIRDHVDIIVKVKGITDQMRWNGKIFHSENGPFHSEKILLLDNSE